MEVKILTLQHMPGNKNPALATQALEVLFKNALHDIEEVERGTVVSHSIAIDCRNMEIVISILWQPNLAGKILHAKRMIKEIISNQPINEII